MFSTLSPLGPMSVSNGRLLSFPRAPPAQVVHPGHRVGDCTAGQQHLDQTLSGGNLHLLLLSEADVQHQVDSGEEAVSADQQHQGKERPHLKFYRNVHNNY